MSGKTKAWNFKELTAEIAILKGTESTFKPNFFYMYTINYTFPQGEDGPLALLSGTPIWPLLDSSELDALESLASVLGGSLEPTENFKSGTRTSIERPGLVLGIGAAGPLAKLYAHLTQRAVKTIGSWQDIETIDDLAVVVMLVDEMDYGLLEKLYPPHELTKVPGIVTARNLQSLRQQVLLKAATLVWNRPHELKGVEWLPSEEEGHRVSKGAIRLVKDSPPEFSRKVATEMAKDLFHIYNHSDGLDFNIWPFFLCPLPPPSEYKANEDSAPWCQLNEYCYRLEQPLEMARKSPLLLRPTEIQSRIFLFHSCLGVQFEPHRVHPDWRLAIQLIESARIGLTLTTWKIIFTTPGLVKSLMRNLLAGVPVGKAVAQFNGSPLARYYDVQFCIFGDPALQLETNAFRSIVLERDPFNRPVPAPGPSLNFWQVYLADQAVIHKGKKASQARRLLRQANTLEVSRNKGNLPELKGFYEDLLSFMFRDSLYISRYWMAYGSEAAWQNSRKPCPDCGAELTRWKLPFRNKSWTTRLMYNCPECTLSRDIPEGWENADFNYDAISKKLNILWPETQNQKAAILCADYKYKKASRSWLFREGKTVHFRGLTKGELYLTLAIAVDGQVGILRKSARVDANGQLNLYPGQRPG